MSEIWQMNFVNSKCKGLEVTTHILYHIAHLRRPSVVTVDDSVAAAATIDDDDDAIKRFQLSSIHTLFRWFYLVSLCSSTKCKDYLKEERKKAPTEW